MSAYQNNSSSRRQLTIFVACLFPSFLFFTCFSWSVFTQGAISFSRGDLLVCGMVGVVAMAVSWLRLVPSNLLRLALFQWSMLVVLAPTEFVLKSALRQPASPWYPNTMREITLEVPLEGVARKGTFSTNSLGLRGRQISVDENRETDLSVLCVGGSTTECFYNSDERAWPAQVEQILSEGTKQVVFVGNAGRGGHVAKHHAWQLEHYAYAEDFDVVVILCGWNDLSAAIYSDSAQKPRDIASESLIQGFDFSASTDRQVPFYRNFAIARVAEKIIFRKSWDPSRNIGWRAVVQDPYGNWIQERRAVRRHCVKTGSVRSVAESLDAAVAEFRGDLERIRGGLKDGQIPIFITQPTLCRGGLSEEAEGRLWSTNGKWAYTAEATFLMLSKINEVTRAFCEQHGFAVVDAEASISGEAAFFYDDCHFSDLGCRKIAELVSAKVVEISSLSLHKKGL
jgi:hypothetical protein